MPNTPPAPPALAVRAASRSDVGMRRATNQDSLAILPTPGKHPIIGDCFLMVADGMGAHAAGELASKIATESVPFTFQKSNGTAAPSALRKAIGEANSRIHSKGSSSSEFHGMGTTCSCLVITQGAALVGHVGDSRVYRLRDGTLEQLTFDHSLVWEMAAASKVSEEDVPSCIPKNVITRSLGPHETVEVDLEGPHPLQAGDTFLLCSDGLTGVVDDKLIGAVLATMEPDSAVQTLVDLANLRGGPDNISVIVARVESNHPTADGDHSGKASSFGRLGIGVTAALVCLVAFGWFAFQSQTTGILTTAIGFGASIAYAISGRKTPRSVDPQLPLGGPHGKGPYRRIECRDQAAAAESMRQLVTELADLASEEDTVDSDDALAVEQPDALVRGFLVDWAPHREAHEEADATYEKGDYAVSIASYASIMRSVVQAIRDDDGTHRYKKGQKPAG